MLSFARPALSSLFWIALVLFLSCLLLGALVWRARAQEQVVQGNTQREIRRTTARALAQHIQSRLVRATRRLRRLPRKRDAAASASALQQQVQDNPWIWHAVWLDKGAELRWPRLPWFAPDDALALRWAAMVSSCASFLRSARGWRVSYPGRLAVAQRLFRRFVPKGPMQQRAGRGAEACELDPWLRIALLQDVHLRRRSKRLWRFSTQNTQGMWLLREQTHALLLRTHRQGWIGLVLPMQRSLRRFLPVPLRKRVLDVWLTSGRVTQTSVSAASGVVVVQSPLGSAWSGVFVQVQLPRRERTGVSWTSLLLLACLGIAGLALVLIVVQIRRQQAFYESQMTAFALVTHALKTPVAAQQSLLETMFHAALPPERQRLYRAKIAQENERIGRLIENLLELMRPGLPEAQIVETLELSAFAYQLIEDFEARAEAEGLELEGPSRSPCLVRFPRRVLRLALENLLDNAIRYAPTETRLELQIVDRSEEILIGVCNAVVDERVPAQIEARLEAMTTETLHDANGSGLGLLLTSRILAMHGAGLLLRQASDTDRIETHEEEKAAVRTPELCLWIQFPGACAVKSETE